MAAPLRNLYYTLIAVNQLLVGLKFIWQWFNTYWIKQTLMRIVFLTLTNSAYSVKGLRVAERIKNHWLNGRCVKDIRTFVRLYAVPK